MIAETRRPRFGGFSYAFKLLAGIVVLLIVAGAIAISTIQGLVAENYRALLQRQFVRQMAQFRDRYETERRDLAVEFEAATGNPRLTAAFEQVERNDDRHRFYADFSVQIRPTLTRLDDRSLPSPPFFRFIDYTGHYLEPPASYLNDPNEKGAWTPFREDLLRTTFLPFATLEEEQATARPRGGYLALPPADGDPPILLRLLVFPTYDNRSLFMGDAIVGYPLTGAYESDAAYAGLWTSGRLYAGDQLPDGLRDALEALLNSPDTSWGVEATVSWGGIDYAAFRQPLSLDPRFPPVAQISLFSLAQQQSLVGEIRQTIGAVAIFTLILTIGLALIFSRQITRSIILLVEAAQRIARGDFEVRLPVRSRDEIGRLTNAFNEMASDLGLKERYRAVLDKVTDPRVATALTTGRLELGGEERAVTVLFADIRSFTNLTEKMKPQAVVAFLNEHMTALTGVVHAHGGVVDKFIGDEIMVIFGAPQSEGGEADRAVACAQALIAERALLNRSCEVPAQIGVGLASGPVLAGCMGSEDRLNYTVLGRVVNLAARLCSAAQAGEVVFDAATLALMATPPTPLRQDSRAIKGFSEKIDTFILSRNAIP